MGCGRTCIYVRVIKSVHVKMLLTKATHVFLATRYKPKCSSMKYSVYSVLSYTLIKLFYSLSYTEVKNWEKSNKWRAKRA